MCIWRVRASKMSRPQRGACDAEANAHLDELGPLCEAAAQLVHLPLVAPRGGGPELLGGPLGAPAVQHLHAPGAKDGGAEGTRGAHSACMSWVPH